MSLIPDDLKLQMFPCPNCGHYINDEMEICKFCLTHINDEMRADAIRAEKVDRKKTFLGAEKQIMLTGMVVAGIGLINAVAPMFDIYLSYSWGRVPCLSVATIVFGGAMFIHGLRGYLRESRK